MENLLSILFYWSFCQNIGKYVRYYFFKAIGKKKDINSLSNKYKDKYEDMGKALNHEFINRIVGLITLCLVVIICLLIFS